ncbi:MULTISPECIES: DHH family phosphoesterase [unclassified Mycoplasma]|uniref:DHHA1 domain-containing protein n=1 Tax=unclassified Mycoplasma TaxID=2683645 RepID=UPI000FDE8EEA
MVSKQFVERKKEKLIKQAIALIKKFDKVALFHHVFPDGDTFACSYGLCLALKIRFPEKDIRLVGDYKALSELFPFLKLTKDRFVENIDESWLAIVGDVAVKSRVAQFEQYQKAGQKVCFDHHQNKIDFPVNVYIHDPNYAASALQAFEIIDRLKIKLDEQSSFYLLIGILTDTGNFAYSLADPKAPLYYSELLKNVHDKTLDFFFKNFYSKSKEFLQAQVEFLQSAQLQGKVVYGVIDQKFIEKYPKLPPQRFLSMIANVKDYPIWMLFVWYLDPETGQKYWKINFRSNSINLISLANQFEGGGHARAAGGKASLEESPQKIVQKINKLLLATKKVALGNK